MDEEFDILAAKVLGGEASAEERARLEDVLAASAEHSEEYARLEAVWQSLKAAGPIAAALDAPPEAIPAHHLRRLRKTVRDRALVGKAVAARGVHEPIGLFEGFWRWLHGKTGVSPAPLCAGAVALVFATAMVIWALRPGRGGVPEISAEVTEAYLLVERGAVEIVRAGKAVPATGAMNLHSADELRLASAARATLLTRSGTVPIAGPLKAALSSLQSDQDRPAVEPGADKVLMALFSSLPQLLDAGLLVTTRSSQSILLYSPSGSTANLTPLILWKSEPGKTYDLKISDEFDPKVKPLQLGGVVPPVEFNTVAAWKGRSLAKDGLYRITLSETGKPLSASEFTFRTIDAADGPRPSAPAERLLRAFRILKAEPSRVGDALAELFLLPPEFAESELALRLKLLAFGQLGYQEDFDRVGEKLRSIQATR